jgi:hypothetical protein
MPLPEINWIEHYNQLVEEQVASCRFDASDEEYVERLRRTIARSDRWRPVLLIIYGAPTIALLGFLGWFWTFLVKWLGQGDVEIGLLIIQILGLVVGFSAGLFLSLSLKCFLDQLFGFRWERRLIRYHDALRDGVNRLKARMDTLPPR